MKFGMNLKAEGFRTVALHPFNAANWNRSDVYSKMEFDEFISIENWGDDIENIRWCASDRSAYEKVIKLIDEKEEGEKLFTFLVTMQNHGGYTAESLYGYEPTVELNYDSDYPQAETYLSLINESDKAFQELVEHFETEEEPTMIVMFGDHLPAIEDEFYEELFQKSLKDLDIEEEEERYKVPYLIWTNYSQESESNPNMSASFLGSFIQQAAGLELNPYNEFLLDLMNTIPIIGQGAICNNEGEWYLMEELPDQYEYLINEYRSIQYNNIIDRKNIVTSVFTVGQN